MKHLRTDIEITKFLMQIKKCHGEVYYETIEGDVLNLSSALSQYVFCSIARQPHYWNTGVVRCELDGITHSLQNIFTKVMNNGYPDKS